MALRTQLWMVILVEMVLVIATLWSTSVILAFDSLVHLSEFAYRTTSGLDKLLFVFVSTINFSLNCCYCIRHNWILTVDWMFRSVWAQIRYLFDQLSVTRVVMIQFLILVNIFSNSCFSVVSETGRHRHWRSLNSRLQLCNLVYYFLFRC